MIERLDYISINGPAVASMLKTKELLGSVDARLRALIEVRISQINGCVYCVDVHIAEARAAGETEQRLDSLAVWHECPFFDTSERVALAWAEAVTLLPDTGAPKELYEDLVAEFSDQQVVDLTFIVAQMNAWNRLAVSFRHMPEEK